MTTARQSIVAFTAAVFGLSACNNSGRQTNSEYKSVPADTFITKTASGNVTLVHESSSYPAVSSFTAKVLTVGTFHEDEVWDNADKEKWFGLFQNTTGFYIAETKLRVERAFDAVVDKENEQTGWEVQTENKDPSIILIGELNFLTPHNVQQAALSEEQIFPGDTLQINYLGINYEIYATGENNKAQDASKPLDICNYKLYLEATIKGQQHKSLLAAQPDFDDKMINLIFAGDIDGDGILDLIIDTSRHYNVTSPTVYLSRPAENGELIKPIGGHTSVGC